MVRSLSTFLWANFREHFSRSLTEEDLRFLQVARRTEDTISLYILQKGCSAPVCHVKTVRNPEDADMLRREFRALEQVRRRLSGTDLEDSIPRPLALANLDGSVVLVLSVLSGKPLSKILAQDSLWLRRGWGASRPLAHVCNWLTRFQEATSDGGRLFRWTVHDPLENLILNYPGVDLKRYRGVMDRLARLTFEFRARAVASHGDMQVRSLLVSRAGLRVNDWSQYREAGHPLEDLLDMFFSAGALVGDCSGKPPFAFLMDPSFWLHNVFLESLAGQCSRINLKPDEVQSYLLSYALRRLNRALAMNDYRSAKQGLQLIENLVEHEHNFCSRLLKCLS